MRRHTMMRGVVGREGRVACIGVLLTDQEGSQHQRAGTAREQEDSIGGRYSIGIGQLRQLPLSVLTPGENHSPGNCLRRSHRNP